MDNILLEREEKTARKPKANLKTRKTEDAAVSRVVISKEADDALEVLLTKARDGFDGGEINRSDIVNWLLKNHDKLVSEAEIKLLRAAHFDEMLAWNKLTKLANHSGGLSEELKAQFKSLLNSANKKTKGVE